VVSGGGGGASAARTVRGCFDFANGSLYDPFARLRMTGQTDDRCNLKTGSRGSPSEANRGDVHLNRIGLREKSCPGRQKI
jgi:hypothetical protein